ncbi:MAG: hypothetical protein RR263_04340 [Oscillospiraceae bacterium]
MAFILTEAGRLIDTSPNAFGKPDLEFIDGAWVNARSPLYGWETAEGKLLSPAEVVKLVKSGKFNFSHI